MKFDLTNSRPALKDFAQSAGNTSAHILGFGTHISGMPINWSFRGLLDEDLQGVFLRQALGYVANAYGIQEIIAPTPEFGVQVYGGNHLESDFPTQVRIQDKESLRKLTIYRGLKADGWVLGPGETYGITQAGCAIVIILDPMTGQVGVAHAGLRCVIDEEYLFGGKAKREYESIVDALIYQMTQCERARPYLRAIIAFPISPELYLHQWDHPEWGEKNRGLCQHLMKRYGSGAVLDNPRELGRVDIAHIVRTQLVRKGFRADSIETLPAYDLLQDEGGNFLWHTTRTTDPLHRNLVLVQNTTGI